MVIKAVQPSSHCTLCYGCRSCMMQVAPGFVVDFKLTDRPVRNRERERTRKLQGRKAGRQAGRQTERERELELENFILQGL